MKAILIETRRVAYMGMGVKCDITNLANWIKYHEGLKQQCYNDGKGLPTIGYGHLLRKYEIGKLLRVTKIQADALFNHDFSDAMAAAWRIPGFWDFSMCAQFVLVDMVFNMGLPRVSTFDDMLTAIRARNYHKAAEEILNSLYAKRDCPKRAARNATIMVWSLYE